MTDIAGDYTEAVPLFGRRPLWWNVEGTEPAPAPDGGYDLATLRVGG